MVIHEASENYLKAIFRLSKTQETVRAVDICHLLGFAKSTVSIGLKKLRESDYIEIDHCGSIHLTETGIVIAEKINERHILLVKLFMLWGVDEKTAFQDACKMEHDISEKTFQGFQDVYLRELQRLGGE